MPNWVLPGVIATSPRPGYSSGPEKAVAPETVESWAEATRTFGIASIICLIGRDQLPLYHSLRGGLLAYYREAGFEVAHVPTFDGLTVPYTPEQYEFAWEEFQRLPKPVLVHCSAGMDRTFRVVNYLVARLESGGRAIGYRL